MVLLLIYSCHTFQDCGSKDGVLESVSVSGCKKDAVCVFNRNAYHKMDVLFSNVDAKVVTAHMSGIFDNGAIVQFSSINSCTDYGITCPITKDQRNNYKRTLRVPKMFPTKQFHLKFELKEENEENFVCVIIPVKLQ